jgi:hypothetical protein
MATTTGLLLFCIFFKSASSVDVLSPEGVAKLDKCCPADQTYSFRQRRCIPWDEMTFARSNPFTDVLAPPFFTEFDDYQVTDYYDDGGDYYNDDQTADKERSTPHNFVGKTLTFSYIATVVGYLCWVFIQQI